MIKSDGQALKWCGDIFTGATERRPIVARNLDFVIV
jgi:hypothetical protein